MVGGFATGLLRAVRGYLLSIPLLACATGRPARLSDAQILDVLRSNTADVMACKTKQREADPSFTGKITVKLVITKEGIPTRIEAAPESHAESVGVKCVLAAVETWRFPPFAGEPQPIDFPVEF
jgi:hypothetical protein